MFNELQMAQAEYILRNAKYNTNAAEGATVRVPNLIDRAVLAVRNMLQGRTLPEQPRTTLARHSVVVR